MFERLLTLFQSPPKTLPTMPEPDAQVALGTLLVRTAMIDGAYLFEEVEQIDRVLMHAFDLGPLDAAKLRATCERFHHELPDDVDLAEIIHHSVDLAHRKAACAGLWAVIIADGTQDAREITLAEIATDHLGLDRDVSDEIREAVVKTMKS